MYAHTFTIFTPTYNRAHTLAKVYASIQAQRFRDFEWLIVDDGSTDDSKTLIERWAQEASFPIRYLYQPNGHKKTAINNGVQHAQGELFLILDSDDEMLPDSLTRLHEAWLAIPEADRMGYAGVTGLCINAQGERVGSLFPSDCYDSDSISIRYNARVTGEKWGFNRTDVMREFPFPQTIPGLVPEALIWNRIAKHYKMRFINEVVRIYHDEGDSISRTNVIKNTPGFRLFYHESLCQEWTRWFSSPWSVLKLAANSVRYDLHGKDMDPSLLTASQCGWPVTLLRWLVRPLAYWQYLKDQPSH